MQYIISAYSDQLHGTNYITSVCMFPSRLVEWESTSTKNEMLLTTLSKNGDHRIDNSLYPVIS